MKPASRVIRLAALFGILLLGLLLVLGLLAALAERPASQVQMAPPGPAGVQTAKEGLPEEPLAAIQTAHKTSPALPPISAFPPNGSGPPGWIANRIRSASSGTGQPWGIGGPVPPLPDGRPAFTEPTGHPAAGAGLAGTWGGAAAIEAPGIPLGTGDTEGGLEPMSIPPMPSPGADLALCLTSQRVWGIVGAGDTVTVAVNGVQMGADRADQIGFFWTTLYGPDGNRPDLAEGGTVAIYRNGTQAASVPLWSINGALDYVNDVVSGTIGGVSTPVSVTVYALDEFFTLEPTVTSYSQTVSTDDSGHFVADFSGVWDFVGWDYVVVGYIQNGVEVHRHLLPIPSLMVRPSPWNWVFGIATPGESLTITLFLSDGLTVKETATASANATGGYFAAFSEILETDIVALELSDGKVLSRTIDPLTATVDAASDRIVGEARPGARVMGRISGLTPQGYRNFQVSANADSSGVYTLEFGAITDIMPGVNVPVFVDDAEGDNLNIRTVAPLVNVHQTQNEVSGIAPAPPGPLAAGRWVTLTLYSAANDTTYVYSKRMGWYGQYNFTQDDDLPDIAPGDVVTVEAEGSDWQGVVQVMTITVEPDVDADRFTGEVVSPTGRVELSGNYFQGHLYPAGGQFATLATASSPFTATLTGFDVSDNLGYEVAHRVAEDHLERISRQTDG
ncbi:MAG: hypothetical protein N3B68_07915, partial [Anaerolineae bacterium]|nr:hypothetical protein [Anaerolineae bacterium]